jgi:gas vesicle protein
MTGENTTPEAEGGFLGGLLDKAKEFGEKAKDLAEDAIEHVKDFAEDLPENAKKITDDTVAAVKDFAEDFPENAKKITDDTVAGVKNLVDGDAPTDPPAPTA